MTVTTNGSVTLLPPGLTMDMRGGWTADGRIAYDTQDMVSALWRYRRRLTVGVRGERRSRWWR